VLVPRNGPRQIGGDGRAVLFVESKTKGPMPISLVEKLGAGEEGSAGDERHRGSNRVHSNIPPKHKETSRVV